MTWTPDKARAAFPLGSRVYHRGTARLAGVSLGQAVVDRGGLVRLLVATSSEGTLRFVAGWLSVLPRDA